MMSREFEYYQAWFFDSGKQCLKAVIISLRQGSGILYISLSHIYNLGTCRNLVLLPWAIFSIVLMLSILIPTESQRPWRYKHVRDNHSTSHCQVPKHALPVSFRCVKLNLRMRLLAGANIVGRLSELQHSCKSLDYKHICASFNVVRTSRRKCSRGPGSRKHPQAIPSPRQFVQDIFSSLGRRGLPALVQARAPSTCGEPGLWAPRSPRFGPTIEPDSVH